MSIRKLRLESALDEVLRRTRLRRPQREALERFHQLVWRLDEDLSELSQADLSERLRDLHPDWKFVEALPSITCALATGVGKTRLIGALMAYLYLSGQSRNFCLLAPRAEIVRKLIAECQVTSPKYIFGDRDLVPEPLVWHSGNLEQFGANSLFDDDDDGLNIFVISPQALVGDNRRAWAVSEFSGESPAGYLAKAKDLVVFADEAHHIGAVAQDETTAWAGGIRDLAPRLMIGMTATPRKELGTNILYAYDLATCLREGLYTKAVRVIVEPQPSGSGISDLDWDKHTLDFAIDRLRCKEKACESFLSQGGQRIKPVLLVCAADTSHADYLGEWLVQSRDFTPNEVLVVHSKRGESEAEIRRLVEVENPSNPVRVVVNVQKLTEGWDVSNVFVIAPLRAMSTFAGAVQSMGRGLRLPVGRRISVEEIDTLDVLCFGKEGLSAILNKALSEFGNSASESLDIRGAEDVSNDVTRRVEIELSVRLKTQLTIPSAKRVPPKPNLDFDTADLNQLTKRYGAEFELGGGGSVKKSAALRYDYEVFVGQCVNRILAGLIYLSPLADRGPIEKLVCRSLSAAGIEQGTSVFGDWLTLAEGIKERIDKPYRQQAATFSPTGSGSSLAFQPLKMMVEESKQVPLNVSAVTKWLPEFEGWPIEGWNKSVYSSARFDGKPEFLAAQIIDRDAEVIWWMRNDPAQFRVATAIGFYEPDFLILTKTRVVLLEIKGANFWQPLDSDPRVKARAAAAWCQAVSEVSAETWVHAVVLDADIRNLSTVEDLLARSVLRGPTLPLPETA